jgi:hypothetical protein
MNSCSQQSTEKADLETKKLLLETQLLQHQLSLQGVLISWLQATSVPVPQKRLRCLVRGESCGRKLYSSNKIARRSGKVVVSTSRITGSQQASYSACGRLIGWLTLPACRSPLLQPRNRTDGKTRLDFGSCESCAGRRMS